MTVAAVSGGDTEAPERKRRNVAGIVWANLALFFLYQESVHRFLAYSGLRHWSTIFLATMLQALPFLVLGVVVGAAISAFVPAVALARALPKRSILAVPVAGLAGALLPGCECSAAPVTNRLVSRGVEPAVALTFLLAAPAINPIVVVATAVAFPNHPEMVWARFIASLATAIIVGLIWSRVAGRKWIRFTTDDHDHGHRLDAFVATATNDFAQAGGFLVVGASLVATMQTVVPAHFLRSLGGSGFAAILTMACLAVLLSVCSEADAFVAAGLIQFSLTARLAFLVVGPMIDLKLIALQIAVFGRAFAARFAPLVFIIAILSSIVVGAVLL